MYACRPTVLPVMANKLHHMHYSPLLFAESCLRRATIQCLYGTILLSSRLGDSSRLCNSKSTSIVVVLLRVQDQGRTVRNAASIRQYLLKE